MNSTHGENITVLDTHSLRMKTPVISVALKSYFILHGAGVLLMGATMLRSHDQLCFAIELCYQWQK